MSNILIIDDQPYLRELFSLELVDEGYGVESIPTAESAILRIRHSKPDLVLLDLYLDGFEGWDVLRQIKKWAPRIPVLIVTANNNYADDPRLSSADGYVFKSFTNLTELKKKIAEIIDRKAVPSTQGWESVQTGLNIHDWVAISQNTMS
jgi:two-component system response regulator (stage 0 sporulation protein F)